MAFTGQIQFIASVSGVSLNAGVTLSASGQIAHEVSLPAGKAGTLSTRTDDDTGTLTLSSGHGLLDGDLVDVFWTGGSRYGMAVSSSGATTVVVGAVTVGAGDVLPAQDTAIVVCKQVVIDTDFDGDLLQMIAASCDQRASIDFLDAGGASLDRTDLPAQQPYWWFYGCGFTNPLTGNPVASIAASNGSTAAATLRIIALYSSN